MNVQNGLQKLGLSVSEACELLGGISRPSLYRLVSSNPTLRTYKIGARRFFYRADLEDYVGYLVEGYQMEGADD